MLRSQEEFIKLVLELEGAGSVKPRHRDLHAAFVEVTLTLIIS